MEEEKTNWYEKSRDYWANSETSIKGVLGGNEQVHSIDVKTSCELIEGLIGTKKLTAGRVIDCGAGIGRVTSDVLVNYFSECDLMEQDIKYVEFAKEKFNKQTKVKSIFLSSFQDFEFESKYDCIWIQWCLENLDDFDLINFIKKCCDALSNDGLVIIKENIVAKGYVFSNSDYSKQRSDKIFKEIFTQCGLKIFKHFHHPNWPSDLMKVSVFVLKKAN
jgi:protein N-terminal methyltransferase